MASYAIIKSKDLSNVTSIPENPICDIVDIITGRKVLLTLSEVEKNQYFKIYYLLHKK